MALKKKQVNELITHLIVHAVLIFGLILTLFPIIWIIATALKPNNSIILGLNLFPEKITWDNFKVVMFQMPFPGWLWNSFKLATGTTILSMILGVTAAYAYSRFRFPGHGFGIMSFLVLQMLPQTLALVPLLKIFQALNLYGTHIALIIAYSSSSLAFCIWNMKGYFDTVPKDLEEAALIDGASMTGVFFRIILPLSRPALATTALFAFLNGWNEYVMASVLLADEGKYTLALGLRMMISSNSTDWIHFAALSVLVAIPTTALFMFLQRNLISGLTVGGVKG